MIWLDIIDPKYVLFFRPMLPLLQRCAQLLVTTRKSEGYDECAQLLKLFDIEALCIGSYGGADKLGKFQARLDRQVAFLDLFKKIGKIPRLFITGASVDGVHCAYALGIPIIQFADTPVAGEHFNLADITVLSRLCLPLSSLVFAPFVVPHKCYTALGLEAKQVITYDFIDVALWLNDIPPHSDINSHERANFYHLLGFNETLPLVLVREEEYKAHYVKKKLPLIYEGIRTLSASGVCNLLIMPRYESDYLKKEFGSLARVKIIETKLQPNIFYPHIDILLGGGGTMNLEACYLGIPTISTRSLLLFHDRFLIHNALMKHVKNSNEILQHITDILPTLHTRKYQRQDSLFAPHGINLSHIIEKIQTLL